MNLNKLNRMAKEYLPEGTELDAGPQRYIWGRRLVLQLQYAVKLLESGWVQDQELIESAADMAWNAFSDQGTITRSVCLAVEKKLQPLAEAAKHFELLCIGHAHIDMNWMWSYDETVSITLDSFQTMLTLMEEYPDFTYAQSQASVYEIVEKYNPQMLDQIRKRVHEGRWEVTASTWVEADRNMPNAESMSRHLLYTRQYLADLLKIAPESLDIDYEPDTFGHHENVPEILAGAGVRYYYHCRGYDEHVLYRWQSPSGRSIIVMREPLWYNWQMDGRCALTVPQFCRDHGLTSMLRVYGVGDHGGGPTRRDIEQIIEMNTWPIFPHYRFATYRDFFREVEQISDCLPLVTGELNFIFDGCYTTQTRIKRGNRHGEALSFDAEAVGALAHLAAGGPYDRQAHTQSWKNILFNQFHDILTGSGVVYTREHAMGLYQQSFALSSSQYSQALQPTDASINSQHLGREEDIKFSRSEGAGVGFPTGSGQIARVGRHAGLRRLFTLWNPLPYHRSEVCEITIWDWPGDGKRMQWTDDQGNALLHQMLDSGRHAYWGHLYKTVLVKAEIPASGYTTIVLDEIPLSSFAVEMVNPRVDRPISGILENEQVRAEISLSSGCVVSFIDKKTGQEYVRPDQPMAVFNLIEEDTDRGMTSWRVGRYRKVMQLGSELQNFTRAEGTIRQSISWSVRFGNKSVLKTCFELDQGSALLRCRVNVNWQEIGTKEAGIPQLSFSCPTQISSDEYHYSIPMGEIKRPPLLHDVPATMYGLVPNPEGRALALISDSKYGFRADQSGLALTLIRSSYDPDPWPEIGEHNISIGLGLVEEAGAPAIRMSEAFCHSVSVLASKAKTGSLPTSQSLISLDSRSLIISAIKLAEDSDGLIVRLYNVSDHPDQSTLNLWRDARAACLVDVHENPLPLQASASISLTRPDELIVKIPARSLQTIRISFS